MKSIIFCFVIALSQSALSQTGNSILDSDSDIAIFYYNQGINKIELEDYEGAKLDFEKALGKNENFEEAKNSLQILNQSN